MEEKEFSDYLSAFRRNILTCSIIVAIILAISLLTAWLLPPVYRSTSTILIEEQEIPTDLVRSTITSFAAQRLQTISQRVMTRFNLIAIIDKFNLYEKERKNQASDELVERMRQDISFQTVSADVIDPRSGHPTQATIAFTLSYDGKDPGLAQKIDNEITSLYLEENLRMRTKQTAEASDFLTSEVAQIGAYAAELEQKLSKFKENHLNELPEHKQMTMQIIERTESEIKEIELQLRTLQERNFLIDSQITQISPENPVISATGQHVMSASERLKSLRTQYISLAAQYSAKHPDLVKTRQEIEALEKEVGEVDPSIDQARRLHELREKRSAMSEKYAGAHPDIETLDKQIAALEHAISLSDMLGKKGGDAVKFADNPVYLGLSAQKQSNVLEIAGLSKRRSELQAKLLEYEKRVRHSPDVERQYLALARDWENTNNRYREMKAKQMEAQIAEQLERKSKGERFSIIEPPLFPEKPIKPNRPVIVLVGFVLALLAAAGYVGIRETFDKTIRKTAQIVELLGVPPLAVIPYLAVDGEARPSRQRVSIIVGLAIAGFTVSVLLIHWLWMPVDVLWFRSIRALEKLLG
jgi:succinoglycan biosynthesis transport protein ExoP